MSKYTDIQHTNSSITTITTTAPTQVYQYARELVGRPVDGAFYSSYQEFLVKEVLTLGALVRVAIAAPLAIFGCACGYRVCAFCCSCCWVQLGYRRMKHLIANRQRAV